MVLRYSAPTMAQRSRKETRFEMLSSENTIRDDTSQKEDAALEIGGSFYNGLRAAWRCSCKPP